MLLPGPQLADSRQSLQWLRRLPLLQLPHEFFFDQSLAEVNLGQQLEVSRKGFYKGVQRFHPLQDALKGFRR
jgi:hypothetical protein